MPPVIGRAPFTLKFDIGTIKHLGLQMYSTLPPVIGELVSNAWDADAQKVDIQIPPGSFSDTSEIVVSDDGIGMSDTNVREAYLVIGRDRRLSDGDTTKLGRPIMGRKGIGKFSAFGIAREIEVETLKGNEHSRFKMSLNELYERAKVGEISMPILPRTAKAQKGTRVTLRKFEKYRSRSVAIDQLRRGLARRFSIIGTKYNFEVKVNGSAISATERDLKRLLDKREDGSRYIWEFDDEEIKKKTGWKVSGWIGALNRTDSLDDGIQRGIVIMARGKLVQDPFVFDAVVGQQYALSYLVGEIHAEFVDDVEDTISTARNSLVWDSEANIALKEWGQATVNRIAREWAEIRSQENEKQLESNPLYQKYQEEAEKYDDGVAKRAADKLIREIVTKNPLADVTEQEGAIRMAIDFIQFDAFKEMAEQLAKVDINDVPKVIELFRDWEVIEAKEMMRVTEGRIQTIDKLQQLMDKNALEVPTLHDFLKEFPWVLDPRWTLVADEVRFSKMLREKFPEAKNIAENDKRIDFLCVRESTNLIVVEIKRPKHRASTKELQQIEDYVNFIRDVVSRTSDPEVRHEKVVGYLLCGSLVDTYNVREKRKNLMSAEIYVRLYDDLLAMVRKNHKEFLDRYENLRASKKKNKKKR